MEQENSNISFLGPLDLPADPVSSRSKSKVTLSKQPYAPKEGIAGGYPSLSPCKKIVHVKAVKVNGYV